MGNRGKIDATLGSYTRTAEGRTGRVEFIVRNAGRIVHPLSPNNLGWILEPPPRVLATAVPVVRLILEGGRGPSNGTATEQDRRKVD